MQRTHNHHFPVKENILILIPEIEIVHQTEHRWCQRSMNTYSVLIAFLDKVKKKSFRIVGASKGNVSVRFVVISWTAALVWLTWFHKQEAYGLVSTATRLPH